MKHVLEADGIFLSLGGRNILSSVYIRNETGRVTGLLGRNGEGKTCLMNVIYGRLPAESRSIRLNGAPFPHGWKQPRLLRYAPQFHFAPSYYSLKRIFNDFEIDFSRFCKHFPEFNGHSRSRLRALSGGHRRLVEIYAILCSETQFVMLDEPFSHIMPLHVETLRKVISQEKDNKGILISDHLYREVIDASDDLYLLANGDVKSVQDPEELEALGYLRGMGKAEVPGKGG